MNKAGLSGVSVLIVDDEKEFAEALADRLELRGLVVRTVFSGESGLAALEEALPDVLLLDMRMPGLSGVDLLRRIRTGQNIAEGAFLPVIVISGHSSRSDYDAASALGIQGYILKPLQLDELLEALAEAVGKPGVEGERNDHA